MDSVQTHNAAGAKRDAASAYAAAISESGLADMAESAAAAAEFLKALSHEGRLMILCNLVGGELSVTELEQRVGMRQAAVSQQLARLRLEGLVVSRREGKAIYYALGDERVAKLIGVMHELFCGPQND